MKNYNNQVVFATEELKIELEKNSAFLSDDKLIAANKNKAARLKRAETFCKASNEVLMFIASNSDENTLEYLINPSNYKQAEKTLFIAQYYIEGKRTKNLNMIFNGFDKIQNQDRSAVSIEVMNLKADSMTRSRFINFVKSMLQLRLISRIDKGHWNSDIKAGTKFSIDYLINVE